MRDCANVAKPWVLAGGSRVANVAFNIATCTALFYQKTLANMAHEFDDVLEDIAAWRVGHVTCHGKSRWGPSFASYLPCMIHAALYARYACIPSVQRFRVDGVTEFGDSQSEVGPADVRLFPEFSSIADWLPQPSVAPSSRIGVYLRFKVDEYFFRRQWKLQPFRYPQWSSCLNNRVPIVTLFSETSPRLQKTDIRNGWH